ncbi:MAG: zinc ribbon domain-containing protein [Eubacteriales bacterium]|nr:zinc ribbon domain-containing protein [Eubacteriales bacterium]
MGKDLLNETTGFKECLSCGAQMPGEAKFCEKCGCSLGESSVSPDLTCTVCGAHLESDMKFCAKCGSAVGNAQDEDLSAQDQEFQQFAENAKALVKTGMDNMQEKAKTGVEQAKKGAVKGMAMAAEKMASAAEKMSQEDPKENLNAGNPEMESGSVDLNNSSVPPVPTPKAKRSIKNIILGIAALIAVIFVVSLMVSKNPVSDLQEIVFSDWGSQTLGEVVEESISGAEWSSEKINDKNYRVTVSGFSVDLYSNIELIFDVNYSDDYVYGSLYAIVVDGETYTDVFSTAFIMAMLYE